MEITIDLNGDKKTIKSLGRISKAMHPQVKRALTAIGIELQKDIKLKLSGNVLNVRSNTLRRSIQKKVVDSGKNLFVQVGTNVVYAAAHEYGADIRPVNAKHLWIPLDAAKTKAGVVRGNIRAFINEGNTFFAKSKAGNLILFRTNADKSITPLFVAKDFVKIPKSPFMRPALKENRQMIIDTLWRAVRKATDA